MAENAVVSMDQYRNGRYNLLVPTSQVQQISPFHKMRVEEVKIDPNPDSGDVFKVGSKKKGGGWEDVLSLSKTAILKLANAAGLIWNWNETRVVVANRDYVLYQAVGAIRKPSGEWIPVKATKEIDLSVIEEEVHESNLKKARDMDPKKLDGLTQEQWAKNQTKSNMIQWRKNKLMRAETGALLRVVRALLTIKHQYSPVELQHPFIVPRVDFSPDYNDPTVKNMMLEYGVKATTELFGAATGAQQGLPPAQAVSEAMGGASAAFESSNMGEIIDAGNGGDDGVMEEIPPDYMPDEMPPEDLFGGGAQPGEFTCSSCGASISEKVASFSSNKIGRPLCMRCQKEECGQ
ncbi:MAG TPA: hypothetical protein DEA44_07475 [Firmicutes bacterium]|nr:hypothetical protein [Bacillota bacterium]